MSLKNNIRLILCLVASLLLLTSPPCLSWEGVDSETGDGVEIDKGNLVRRGHDIEFFDDSDGATHEAEVQSIKRYGATVEIEVFDHDKGEYRTLEMDDR